jgi:hypothetical protein
MNVGAAGAKMEHRPIKIAVGALRLSAAAAMASAGIFNDCHDWSHGSANLTANLFHYRHASETAWVLPASPTRQLRSSSRHYPSMAGMHDLPAVNTM